MSCKFTDIDLKDIPCGEQIKAIYIVAKSDMRKDGIMKRKYGKFKREVYKYR